MDFIGSGIPTAIRLEIKQDFRPDTQLALKWVQCASGKWVATDRGAAADVYKCKIRVTGYESYINSIIMALYNNRIATTGTPNVITLSNFAATEKIFGEDVNYTSSISATVTEVAERQQTSLYAFQIELTLQAINPTFTGAAGTVVFENLEEAYRGYAEQTINKYDTYNSTFNYLDHRADYGIFEGTAYLTNANMVTFLRSLATQRSAPVTTTVMNGVNYVFGPTKNNTWPRNLVYLEVQDLGYWGLNRHRIKIKAAEDVGETFSLTYSETVIARNPIAYWRLGETTGTTAVDQMAIQDGAYTGAVTLGETGPAATVDGLCPYFNGAKGDGNLYYVEVPNNTAFGGMSTLTIECWMSIHSWGGFAESFWSVISKYLSSTGDQQYRLFYDIDNHKLQFEVYEGDYSYYIVNSRDYTHDFGALSLDTWYYVVIVLEGTAGNRKLHMYINGVETVATDMPNFSTVVQTTVPLRFAYDPIYSGDEFNGNICEIAVYNTDWYTALTNKDWWNYL